MNIKPLIVGVALVIAGGFAFKIVGVGDLRKLQCRAKQTEATSQLKEAAKHLNERLSKGEHPRSFADVGWYPKTERYEIFVADTSGDRFRIEAHAKGADLNGDAWSIDETSTLRNDVEGCRVAR